MLNDIIKIAIGFVFTGILGATISSKIQRKNFVNQTKISKTEKEVEKIKELAKKNRDFVRRKKLFCQSIIISDKSQR